MWFRLLLLTVLLGGVAIGAHFGPAPGRLADSAASRALAAAATWPAYRFSIVATSGSRVRAWARGVVAPPGAVADAGAENPGFPSFTFRAYFQPDAIFVLTDGTWYRVPYAHPAGMQLQDLQDPLRIWRRVLAAARRARRLSHRGIAVRPDWGSLGEYLTVDLRQVKSGEAVFVVGPDDTLRSVSADLTLDGPDAFTGSAEWRITTQFDTHQPLARPPLPAAARTAREIQ